MEKYIGGDFDKDSTNAFLINENKNENSFFPEFLGTKKRFLFETGSDAFAQILVEIFKKFNKPISLCIPYLYCYETLERVTNKIKNIIPEVSFTHYDFDKLNLTFVDGKANVILFNHFNHYNEDFLSLSMTYRKQDWITIEDFVHAPFDMKKISSDYGFNSLRKFLSLEISVAYLSVDNILTKKNASHYYPIKKEAAALKSEFLREGNLSVEKQYLQLFKSAEASLNDKEIITAAEQEVELFSKIDWGKLLEKRIKNYNVLLEELGKASSFNVLPGKYSYLMITTPGRDKLQSFMYFNNVFPVVHWRDSKSTLKDVQLSLHIDQRYSEVDLKKVSRLLKEFNSKENE